MAEVKTKGSKISERLAAIEADAQKWDRKYKQPLEKVSKELKSKELSTGLIFDKKFWRKSLGALQFVYALFDLTVLLVDRTFLNLRTIFVRALASSDKFDTVWKSICYH